tara:strand:+ start:228 stop:842 length:615 start_codon:yes stop_codon:yes gene_type:complete
MQENAKIKVVANNEGNIISVSPHNPEWGSIRIQQNTYTWNNKGFRNANKRTFFLKAKIDELKECDYTVDTQFSGNIIIKESFEPFFTNTNHKDYERLRDKDLKMAGDTGIICKGVDPETGELRSIYRTTEYDHTGQLPDTLIPHVNGDEIRAANGNASIEKPLSQSELEKLTSKKKDKVAEKVEEKIEEPVEEEVIMEDETFEL